MSRQVNRSSNVKLYCDAYADLLRLLSNTLHADEVDERIMEALNALEYVFAEMTGEACRVTLRLANPNGPLRTYVPTAASVNGSQTVRADLQNSSPREISAIRTLLKPSCSTPYFLFNDLEASSSNADFGTGRATEFNAMLIAAVCAPNPTVDCSRDVKGVLSVENRHGGFDDIGAKALVAFGYEMYFALCAVQKGMYSGCIEEMSLK